MEEKELENQEYGAGVVEAVDARCSVNPGLG
jgi:hypothetical protein